MNYPKKNGLPTTKSPGVYVITNTHNGKVYVGSATSIRGRLLCHRSCLRRGKHNNRYLQNAWKKRGEKAFTFDVMEECQPDVLLSKEQYWIDKLGAAKR